MAKYQGTVRERLVQMVTAELALEHGGPIITDESKLRSELGADSLDLIEMEQLAEDEFGIDLLEQEGDGWVTFGDVLSTVEAKVAAIAKPAGGVMV